MPTLKDPILNKLKQWSLSGNTTERLRQDRKDVVKPTIFVSGDMSLAHLILQRDDANIADRFLKGREIEDFYVPGGTFMLEFLLEACQYQQQISINASSKDALSEDALRDSQKLPNYTVRGPYRRRWIFPHYEHGVLDIREFPQDTSIIQQFPLTKIAGANADRAYRVLEGVGFRKGRFTDAVKHARELLSDKTIELQDHPVPKQVPPGLDDNFRLYLARREKHEPLPAGPFIFVVNCEFAYFGSHDFDNPGDCIANLANICELEKLSDKHVFVLKIKHRSAWNAMRDSVERQIRSSIVQFLVHGDENKRRLARTVMIISADELRQANVYISNHLSWERTIQSAVHELKTVERQMNKLLGQGPCVQNEQELWSAIEKAAGKLAYGFLILPEHLVISFGCDGAVHLTLKLDVKTHEVSKLPCVTLTIVSCNVAVDPIEAEGTQVDKYPGKMRGYDSLLTASLAHRLMKGLLEDTPLDYPRAISSALVFGLKACRFLQVHGYDLYSQHDWRDIHKAVCGQSKGSPSREHLDPYWLSKRFVTRVTELSSWALPAGEVLGSLPVIPFDSLASIIVHRLIKRFNDEAPLANVRDSPVSVMKLLHDIRWRQEREWQLLGFIQVLELPHKYSKEFLDEVERKEPGLEAEANAFNLTDAASYGSFDKTWWRMVDAAIPDNLADCFDFPILLAQEKPQESRFGQVTVRLGFRWKLDRTKSLLIAYVSLLHGLDILHPTSADDARKHLCQVLATAVDTCGSLIAFTTSLPRTDSVKETMNKLLPIVCKGLNKGQIIKSYAEVWERRRLPCNIKDICNISGDGEELLTGMWEGRPEHVLGFLEVLYDAHRSKHGFSPLSLWLGAFPKIQIGHIASIDRREIESFRMLARTLQEYVGREREVQPLNIGVFGPAGSGKSFAVTEIAQAILPNPTGVAFMTFNLSQFKGPEELVSAFEEISDAGIQGKLPVVFWDEYDSRLGTQNLGWLSYFLGPMNDGKYFHREKSRQLPKSIFVFAGSMFKEFAEMHRLDSLARSRTKPGEAEQPEAIVGPFCVEDWRKAKGSDFKSRLTSTLDVLGVNEPELAPGLNVRCDPFGHYIRRAATLRLMLRKIHPQLFDAEGTLRIPTNVARGFLELDEYFHGNRSIEQILRMCDFGEAKVFEYSCLPAASQFLLHASPSRFEQLAEVMGYAEANGTSNVS